MVSNRLESCRIRTAVVEWDHMLRLCMSAVNFRALLETKGMKYAARKVLLLVEKASARDVTLRGVLAHRDLVALRSIEVSWPCLHHLLLPYTHTHPAVFFCRLRFARKVFFSLHFHPPWFLVEASGS